MDPLSILSSVITVVGSTITTLNLVKSIKDTPAEVILLLDDTSGLQILLENLKMVSETSSGAFAPYKGFLGNLLQKANSNLSEVELIVTTRLTRRKSMPAADFVPSFVGSLRAISRLRELHTSLANVKASLTVMLGVVAASEVARSNKALERILEAQTAYSRHDMMNDILDKIQRLSDHLLTAPTSSIDLDQPVIISNVHTQNNAVKGTEKRPQESSFWLSSRSRYHARSFGSEQAIDDEEPECITSDQVSETDSKMLSTARNCVTTCRCRCHSLRHMSTPATLSLAFGSLNLEYVAAPLTTGSCNRRGCNRQSDIGIRMSYFFPPWLLLRTLLATIVVSRSQAVQMELQAPRAVPADSRIFEYARAGNTRALKQLFDSGEASPFDVDADTGSTALTYAIDRNHIETWRFLLRAGVDPLQLNKAHQSAIDNVVNKLLANVAGPDFAVAVRADFDTQEYLQDRGFLGLHMSVLGLTNVPLRTHLDSLTDKVNERDWQGRTALSWASSRGDEDAVAILLNCDANPNIVSNNNSSPLQFAARANRPQCIKLLVDAGANVNHRNLWDVDALAYAIRADDLVERIAPIVEGGAVLTRIGDQNPLYLAAANNRIHQTAYLLSKGATFPRQADCDATTHIAIENSRFGILEMLLHHIKASSTGFGVESIRKDAMKLRDKDVIKLITKILHSY